MAGGLTLLLVASLGLLLPGILSSQDADALVKDFWEWRLAESPEYGIKYALDVDYSNVEEFTEEAFQRRLAKTEELLLKIKDVDISKLEKRKKNSIKVIKSLLEAYKRGYPYRKYGAYNPVSHLTNPINREWKRWVGRMVLDSPERYQQLIRRYEKMPGNIDDLITLMRKAIAANTTFPRMTMKDSAENIMKEEVASEESAFYKPFMDSNMHDSVKEPNRSRLRSDAEQAYNKHVLPAITKFRRFVQDEYIPSARLETGASTMEGGLDFYKECLRWHLSLEISPEEVHQKGLDEVARIKALMEEIKDKDGFNGTLLEFFNHLRQNNELFYQTEEEMLNGYKNIVNTAQTKLKTILKIIPQLPIEVGKIPSRTGPTGYYSDPPLDGSKPGRFLANVNDPTNRPKFDMWALTLHESVPGHHTQTAYAMDQGLPDFRRGIEFRKYYAVPFNFMFFSSYSEGWGLYAEDLGSDMGMYNEKYALFGKYSGEIFRAGRLVVDTGLHAFGWSPERARQYLANVTTLAASQIEFEIIRYLVQPGQSASYKIGELKFLELRKMAEEKLGEHFDLKEFHHQVLSIGAVPLPLLQENIEEWVQTVRDQVSSSPAFLPTYLTIAYAALIASVLVHL